jgi:Zn-dependent peptidase ImmA (M78 family)
MLILPESGVKALIPDEEMGKEKISIKTILKIEHYYSCSRSALLYRLKELSLLSSFGYESFSANVKLGAIQYGYATDLYEPGNNNLVIGNYGEIARELYEKDKISETHYVTLLMDLGMNESELENMFNGEEER